MSLVAQTAGLMLEHRLLFIHVNPFTSSFPLDPGPEKLCRPSRKASATRVPPVDHKEPSKGKSLTTKLSRLHRHIHPRGLQIRVRRHSH